MDSRPSKKCASIKPKWQSRLGSEHGFSLISVLVLLGLISLMALIFSQSRVNVAKNAKNLVVKGLYRDINQALINDLSSFIKSQITPTAPCLGLTSIQSNINNFAVVNRASASYTYSNQIVVDSTAPPQHKAASLRCRTPRLPSSGVQPADNKFYFCIRFGRDVAAPLDSILSAELAFAELAVEMVDLQTQTAISCTDFSNRRVNPNDGSSGLAVTTIFYWQQKRQNGSNFSQKALSYILTEKD